jgi:Zn-dependent peptidase ImmA (M78 family)/DNA-binding XRE family transcriptional regulator
MNSFNPSRLEEARLYRKMTMEELADLIGIKKQSISQFENSKAFPDFKTLNAISKALKFPLSFFNSDNETDMMVGNTYFRAPFSSKQKDLHSQKIKAKYVAYIQNCLSEYVDFPQQNIPKFESIKLDDVNSIERIANQVRDYWGLGKEPIPDMVALLERNGIIVAEFSTEGKTIDAFYQYGEMFGREYYCVVLGTDKLTYARRQFSAAHELAHILLHERYYDIDQLNREEFRLREEQANKFASAFLLPKEAFIKDIQPYCNKLNAYVELKRKWRVAIQTMIMRAADLEIISQNQTQYLWRQISKNGWRTKEPLDEYMAAKSPKALKQAISMLLLNNYLSPKQLFALLAKYKMALPKDVVDEVLNLEPDLLQDETDDNVDTKIIRLLPRPDYVE